MSLEVVSKSGNVLGADYPVEFGPRGLKVAFGEEVRRGDDGRQWCG